MKKTREDDPFVDSFGALFRPSLGPSKKLRKHFNSQCRSTQLVMVQYEPYASMDLKIKSKGPDEVEDNRSDTDMMYHESEIEMGLNARDAAADFGMSYPELYARTMANRVKTPAVTTVDAPPPSWLKRTLISFLRYLTRP